MSSIVAIIIATVTISMLVWGAVAFLYFKKKFLDSITIHLVSLSAGALLGGAFFHLLPETVATTTMPVQTICTVVVVAFALFFFMEKFLIWRHCHTVDCKVHSFGYMNLAGDTVHNFIDGLIIAASFLVNPALGITTTIAIALHELPQEIGDFGVLIHAGFERKRALLINYLVAVTVVLGGMVGYYLSHVSESLMPLLLPFAAGGFMYIAASDLIPEIRTEHNIRRSVYSFTFFIIGIGFMALVKLIHF